MQAAKEKANQRSGRPKTEASREKIAQLLIIAREEFSTLGYRAVTMRGVADKAQMSTRTLYNHYTDKFGLFSACLDLIPATFPRISFSCDQDVSAALTQYAIDLVRALSLDASVRLSVLVLREGRDFPELLSVAESKLQHYLIRPMMDYLRDAGLATPEGDDRCARLFVAMVLSELERRTNFGLPLPDNEDIRSHASLVVKVFLDGIREI